MNWELCTASTGICHWSPAGLKGSAVSVLQAGAAFRGLVTLRENRPKEQLLAGRLNDRMQKNGGKKTELQGMKSRA